MTFDAAERARLRKQLQDDKVPGLPPCWNMLMLALLDELEKARAVLPCGHPKALEIVSVESDYRACELCEARSMQRDAETMEIHYRAERDAARALLRDAEKLCESVRMIPMPIGAHAETLRARIAAELEK